MAIGRGFEAVSAFIKSTSWGTAVAAGSGDQLRLLSESITGGPTYMPDESIGGTPFRGQGDSGEERWEGNIETYLRYRGLDLLLAMAMGATSGAPSQVTTTGFAYQQYFRPLDSLEGLYGTFCIDRTGSNDIAEYDSVKVGGFTITGTADERVTASFDLIAKSFSNDSAINTDSTTWTDVDTADEREYVIFEDVAIYLEVESGTLAVGDLIYPSEFTITYNNNLAGDITSANAPSIDEPVRDGFVDVSGTLTFPTFGTASGADAAAGEKWEDAFLAKTNYALEINLTGSVIDAGNNNEFNIFIPNCEFTSSEASVGGAGKIAHTLNFVATVPSDVVNFVSDRETAFVYPIWIEVQNRQGADVLA